MPRINIYSFCLILMYVLLFAFMQIHSHSGWFEGVCSLPVIVLIIIWSEKMTKYIKSQNNISKRVELYRDVFLINYSFLLAIITFLIFQINNSDARGWWPLIIVLGEIYAIILGLAFGLIALLLHKDHKFYTKVFASALFFGYLLCGLAETPFNLTFAKENNLFLAFVILFFGFHSVICLSYKWKNSKPLNG